MKIHEYQAKAILGEFGVSVPQGGIALTAARARQLAEELGVKVVLKAQVHAGGRGRGGGIKIAESPGQAERLAGEMLGKRLVTHQTSVEGVPVGSVLVEEALEGGRELYVGITIDGAAAMPVMMASEAGGMEIEEVAAQSPEKILRAYIDPVTGFQSFHGRRLAYGLNLEGGQIRPASTLMANLYRVFREKDCSLVEINPLVACPDGRLVGLDAKLNFDDNALSRHPEIVELRDLTQEEPSESQAAEFGSSYIKFDGDIGCLVNGAGLAMATMDMIKLMGAQPANFLDVGGGASSEAVANAIRIILSDPKVRAVLINVFGGILRCDIVAQGIVEATNQVEVRVPLVVRLRGTNLEEGQRILAESGLGVIVAANLREAAEKAVAAARPNA
jgi:succinyl-CoA synthetase beta subunit